MTGMRFVRRWSIHRVASTSCLRAERAMSAFRYPHRLPPARSIGRLGGGILSQRTANKNEAGRGISSVTKAYPSSDARPRMTTYEEARSGYFVPVPECFNSVIDFVQRFARAAPDLFALDTLGADGETRSEEGRGGE